MYHDFDWVFFMWGGGGEEGGRGGEGNRDMVCVVRFGSGLM